MSEIIKLLEEEHEIGKYTSVILEAYYYDIDKLEEMIRLQMAAISVASLCNTKDSLKEQRLTRNNTYWTPAYEDVVCGVSREIKLIEELKRSQK